MKKNISIDQLRPGMYIVGIDQSWFKTPFLRHKRTIRDEDEITILRDCNIRQVSIDVDKGEDVARAAPPEDTRTRTVDEELPIARAVREEASHAIQAIFEGILTGEPIPSLTTKHIVDTLIESIARCPQASLILTMQQHDARLHAHSIDTCVLSLIVGTAKGYLVDQLEVLGLAALLHDVGLMRIPRNIVRKQDPLISREIQIFQTHPRLSEAVLRESPDLDPDIVISVGQHHERINGSGYPNGESSPVPLAQIVSICDTYSELLSGQYGETPYTPPLALRRLVSLGAEGHFDPVLVELALKAWGISVEDQHGVDDQTVSQVRPPLVIESDPSIPSDEIAAPTPEASEPVPHLQNQQDREAQEYQEEDEEDEEEPTYTRKTVATLLEDYPQHMKRLHTAVAKKKAEPVERAAQSFRSVAYNLGDTGTYEASLRVEQLSQEENFQRLPPALQQLESELQRLHKVLFNSETTVRRPVPSLWQRGQTARTGFEDYSILLADRTYGSRVILIEFLRRQSIRTLHQATDGVIALQILHKLHPDLIIADWDLPELSGIEVLRTMRKDELLKNIPMLMLTGTATRKEVVEAAEAGVNGYLLKPFTLQILTEQLQRVLRPYDSLSTMGRGQHYF